MYLCPKAPLRNAPQRRPAPWREVWHRLKTVASEDEAIEAIGDLRELLVEEDLLLPDGKTR